MKASPLRLTRLLLGRALESPTVLLTVIVTAIWMGHTVSQINWSGSSPRTLSDRQLLKSFPNAMRGLYGSKPVYHKVNDPAVTIIG